MEVDKCLMLQRVFLFDEPSMQGQLILCYNSHLLVYHVALARVSVGFRIVLWVAESLIGRIRDVQHPILHEVDH
jgi:hypothetical protein